MNIDSLCVLLYQDARITQIDAIDLFYESLVANAYLVLENSTSYNELVIKICDRIGIIINVNEFKITLTQKHAIYWIMDISLWALTF